nr:hypothetical protein [Mycobacterium gordonae]
MAYEYRGVISRQVSEGPAVVMFSAPAVEIERWAAIPQRRRIDISGDAVETAGFQRESRPTRVHEIARFMQDRENVIQNPLLTAIQDSQYVEISEDDPELCTIRIQEVDFSKANLVNLVDLVRDQLISRLPELATRIPPNQIVTSIREDFAEHYSDKKGDTEPGDADDVDDGIEADEESLEEDEPDVVSGLFQEETQVVDFYDELNARSAVLHELGDKGNDLISIGGFTRDYLEGLLRPIVLVDGQHRLLGALEAIDLELESEEGRNAQARYIADGDEPAAATDRYAAEVSRSLPISLLATASPAEHVFQFVVVNQKATPMSNALLGTIVSTSLTSDELDKIAVRLSDAGIKLESSRAVAYLSRSSDSPFCGLVSTGISGDVPHALPWSVLLRLANMVRDLEGGKSFHPPRIDYIRNWSKNYLDDTGLIPADVGDRFDYWRNNDGPWRKLFIKLHTKIRDFFGDTNDMKTENAWGTTESNLFNMVSLTILTQDFFNFLRETGNSLKDWGAVDAALDEWLDGLNPGYFNRNWRMKGTKKDQKTIKEAWSSAWFGYRMERDRLPRVEVYNPGGSRT